MNIKKYIIVLSFAAFSFIGSIQIVSASCSLQSLKECDRAGLISVIMDLIASHQLTNDKAFLSVVKNGNLEEVRQLILKGANVNAKDNKNYTALMVASKNGKISIVRELILKGADVNALDIDNGTALMEASYYNNIEVVRELINAGANKSLKDKRGKTALDYAKKNSDMFSLLGSNAEVTINVLYFSKSSFDINNGTFTVQVGEGKTTGKTKTYKIVTTNKTKIYNNDNNDNNKEVNNKTFSEFAKLMINYENDSFDTGNPDLLYIYGGYTIKGELIKDGTIEATEIFSFINQ